MATNYKINQAKRAYNAYLRSNLHSLNDCYKSYSIYKGHAFNYCEKVCCDLKGIGPKIISHNLHFFTYGFEYQHPETGVVMFYYITPNYEVAIEI